VGHVLRHAGVGHPLAAMLALVPGPLVLSYRTVPHRAGRAAIPLDDDRNSMGPGGYHSPAAVALFEIRRHYRQSLRSSQFS